MGYSALSASALKAIDAAARLILREMGVRLLDPEIREQIAGTGIRVSRDGDRLYPSGRWLNRMLGSAPGRITLYSRDGGRDLHLGAGRVHMGNGGRAFQRYRPADDSYHPTVLADVWRTARLVDQLSNLDYYIIACQAADQPRAGYHRSDFFQAFRGTTKHVMGGCDDLDGADQMLALATEIAGGEDALRARPFVSVITNPVSPLTYEGKTARILKRMGEHGVPVTCAPAPVCGGTAPASLAGNLAQMHAEALFGVAMVQAFNPGSPVLYGAVPTTMDLRRMDFTFGSAEMALMNAAAVQLAHRYRLPIYGSAGITDAKRPDEQSGRERCLSDVLVALAGADLIHLAAGMLDSGNTICFEQYVLDNELVGSVKRVLEGVDVTPETLGVDVIREVVGGGQFVTAEHTVDHMMSQFFYPDLAVRENFDQWDSGGRPDTLSRAGEVAASLLSEEISCLPGKLETQLRGRFPELGEG